MSIDFSFACTGCEKYKHAGQMMGGRFSFGYGSGDREGVKRVEDFVYKHMYCGEDNGVGKSVEQTIQLIASDGVPDHYADVDDDDA